jgi:hypothetical protein
MFAPGRRRRGVGIISAEAPIAAISRRRLRFDDCLGNPPATINHAVGYGCGAARNQEEGIPTLEVADGEIYFEVYASGYPLVIFAPRGRHSERSRRTTVPGRDRPH